MWPTTELVPDASLLLGARKTVCPIRRQNLLTRLQQRVPTGRSRAGTRRDTASTLLFQEQVAGRSVNGKTSPGEPGRCSPSSDSIATGRVGPYG
jgi:hypothetical protein